MWFSEYPNIEQAELAGRFCDDDYVQHISAWWELYIFTLFRRLGYEMAIHPDMLNTTRKPDFLATQNNVSMYVECVTFQSGIGPVTGQGAGERAWIFEATNQASNPNFLVDIEIHRSGNQRPKAGEIVRPLESWLSSLDPDEVLQQIDAGMSGPDLVLEVRGWVIHYEAWPVEPEHRGKPGRLIGVYPMIGGVTNNEMFRYRDLVKYKGGHYGSPDQPFVIAVLNTAAFLKHDEIAEAMFGTKAVEYIQGQPGSAKVVRKRDGYWRQGPPRRGGRVSAVLDGKNIYPWSASASLPKLWVNPWADLPLTTGLPFATFTAHDTGEVHQTGTGATTESVLGLSVDWPGFAH